MSTTPFAGFSRPRESFYRLPNDWFDILADLRMREERRRIASLVRLVEYIIKWTWGRLNFEGYVRLTFDELQHGKVIGRQDGRRLRADRGTGLPRSGLNEALSDALRYGLLERITDARDAARVRHAYRVRLAKEETPDEGQVRPDSPFPGFRSPQTNYFIVPKVWTDLIADETSDVLILAVEYLFRHCWGWGRADEVHWFTAEDIALGRPYRTLGEEGLRRYDRGIGYAVDSVRRALETGVERGWLVWRLGTTVSGREARVYTLRRYGWPLGEWKPPLAAEPPEPLADSREPIQESGHGGDLFEPIPDKPTLRALLTEPHDDLSEPRAVIPTEINPHTAEPQRPTSQGERDNEAPAQPKTIVLSVPLPYRGTTVEARGRPWQRGDPLQADEVLLMTDDDKCQFLVISETEAARLLSSGLPRQQLGWSADWFWSADGDGEPSEAAVQKARRVSALAEEMQERMQAWGAWNLLDALEQSGLTRSQAQEWIARWGEERVGNWLKTLRRDPTVRSLPAVMYKRLLAGDAPPADSQKRSRK